MTDLIGQQLGNYRLIRLLGTGGCAEVYLGEHIHLKRQAAIKVLHPMLKDEQKADFLIEAQRLVDLSHPSIIPVFDFAIEGDLPYLIMEYAPNSTLRTRHPSGSRLSLATVVSYVNCIAAPLQYLHEQKLIHRDVKPENLLLGKNQEILLSDLGIAAIAHKTSSLSMQGLAGTPPYMAPEQSEGIPRAASDQYALAIVAYEWLCGTVPFQGSSIMGLAVQHLTTPPPSLCQQVPTLPPAVEQVVLKALAKKPQQRFRTITEFAEALEEASQTTQAVAAVSRIEQNQIPPSLSDMPTVLLAEPAQKQYSPSRVVMPLRSTQPLKPLPQQFGWVQDHAPKGDDIVSRPVVIRDRSSAYRSQKPYSSPTTKATALWKRKGLSSILRAVPLIVLVLGISIAGLATYLTSHAAMTLPTASSSPAHQTPTTQPNVLATDTFQRPDQPLWGTTSDGHHQWIVGDASTKQSFSISNMAGSIARGQGPLEALIGQSAHDVDVTVIGIVNHFGVADQLGNKVNLGIVLRCADAKNWYKALIDGNQLSILRSVNGQVVTLKQINVQTSEGVPQRLRFRSLGTTLFAKVWRNDVNQPQDWMIVADDHTFTTGQFGIRVFEQPSTVITITSFDAVKATEKNDA